MGFKNILIKGYNFFYFRLISILNFILFKKNQITIVCRVRFEENALALANFLVQHYPFKVTLLTPDTSQLKPIKKFMDSRINVIEYHDFPRYPIHILKFFFSKKKRQSFKYLFGSKYLFFTHFSPYQNFSAKQMVVNIWHGVGHKKNMSGFKNAKLTVATSEMTKKMFSEIFEVSLNSVFIGGLPRNDILLRCVKERDRLKRNYLQEFNGYKKIIIWMPTFRKPKTTAANRTEKIDIVDNIFNVKSFDPNLFNSLLEKQNSLCIIKSHYFIKEYNKTKDFSNILMIDDDWIQKKGILLYQLLACTDALITDYSSVMIDYSLLDKPIFCIATDLKEFKATQGLYFEDFENWVPTKLFQDKEGFLNAVENFLKNDNDTFCEKRKKIRDLYFQYQDDKSAERIAKKVFNF